TRINQQLPSGFFQEIVLNKNASYRKGFHFYKGIFYQNDSGKYAIIISAHHSYASEFSSDLKTILIIANLISTVLIYSVGVLFSKQILLPIRKITNEVNNISATWLHKRVTIKPGRDEIAELATTFNN